MPKCSECYFEGDYSYGGSYMICQAPGGGPSPNPISKRESVIDCPCGFFKKKQKTDSTQKSSGIVFKGIENDYLFLLKDNPYLIVDTESGKLYDTYRKHILSNNRMVTEYSFDKITDYCQTGIPTPLGISRISDHGDNGKITFTPRPLIPDGFNPAIIDMTKNDEELFTICWNSTEFNNLGLNINAIRGYSIALQFLPTDFYPNLTLIVGIDDGTKDAFNQPDLFLSEFNFSVTSNDHMIKLYELMSSAKVRVILMNNKTVVHDGTIIISDKSSMEAAIQKWWNSIDDYAEKIKHKDNWELSLNQIVSNFGVGAKPITPKGKEIIEKANKYECANRTGSDISKLEVKTKFTSRIHKEKSDERFCCNCKSTVDLSDTIDGFSILKFGSKKTGESQNLSGKKTITYTTSIFIEKPIQFTICKKCFQKEKILYILTHYVILITLAIICFVLFGTVNYDLDFMGLTLLTGIISLIAAFREIFSGIKRIKYFGEYIKYSIARRKNIISPPVAYKLINGANVDSEEIFDSETPSLSAHDFYIYRMDKVNS